MSLTSLSYYRHQPGICIRIRHPVLSNPATSILVIDSMKLSDQWEMIEIYDMDGSRQMAQYFARQQTVVLQVVGLREGPYLAILRRRNGLPLYFRFIRL